ncbi:unnamed protein product [Didymodactylos carnosus]|uniref:Reverse transcriptase domain-containing protein n=1 Tax=Didymodactylos carnosus TaxID=1234261 RepID=A0A816BIU7_9BILA|nr:unnamed protein product [Didymodactylos carnosus]CAF1608831.1 unnamed protein product [Didymodactylos carnosus]CAF3724694.1 unnamed protein product [Didymodactylos carnosus]CAF4490583.1 unnamed protein product [Didymodactylos carnosus]
MLKDMGDQKSDSILSTTNNSSINQCRTCKVEFVSRNQLMHHLEKENHGKQSPMTPLQSVIFEKLNHLPTKQQREAQFMLSKHQTIFDTSNPSAINTTVHHTIQTGNHFPIYHHPRRTSNTIREVIHEETNKMLKEGVIRPSKSPWSSPVVIVRKKDGSPRFCVDYRKINAITQKDVYPLPRMDEIIEQPAGSTWFSKLDLKSGYFQVPISECDKPKTAFATQDGLWEFNRLPQGLINSPPTFQRIMNETLGNLRWDICLVYLDDIIIYSKSFEQHVKDVDKVCQVLAKANFKLNSEKCELFKREITFLGHKINSDGVSPMPNHVKAITAFPKPTSAKDAYSFLQMTGFYRKFVKNFAHIAAPLHKFSNKDIQFVWGSDEQQAFEQLKVCLTTPPVLHLPDKSSPYKVQTDASNSGIGGVLLQLVGEQWKPIAFMSRTLTAAEKKYSSIEKEGLAIWWCITEKFRPYLYVAGETLTITLLLV